MPFTFPRTVERYREAIQSLAVETSPRYQRRDVTGDGIPETFCNFFVADCTKLLACPIPLILANDQAKWLASPAGLAAGWSPCSLGSACAFAAAGHPTVAAWNNPGGHGHVAMVAPSSKDTDLHVAQAGARNSEDLPLRFAFGFHMPLFFTHA